MLYQKTLVTVLRIECSICSNLYIVWCGGLMFFDNSVLYFGGDANKRGDALNAHRLFT